MRLLSSSSSPRYVADVPLWSCLGLFFFFFYAATPTPKRRCQSFSSRLSFSSSSFSQFAVFNHRRTNTISLPRWYLPTRRRACLKKKPKPDRSVREAHGELLLHLVRLFRGEEREGEVWDSSCSFPRLTPPFGFAPSFTHCLPPFFFFFSWFCVPPFSFSLSSLPSSLPPFLYLFNIFGNFYPGLSHNSRSTSLITFLFLTGLVGGTWGSDPSY